jgi:hypothetical protein
MLVYDCTSYVGLSMYIAVSFPSRRVLGEDRDIGSNA